jgi:hypothetical protein
MLTNTYQNYFPKPESDPDFPEDITEYDYLKLGKLQSLFTKWINHVAIEVAKLKGEIEVLDEELSIAEAQYLIEISSDEILKNTYKAKEDRLAWVSTRPKIAADRRKRALLNAQYEMEKTILSNFEKRYAAASRELTRRVEEK